MFKLFFSEYLVANNISIPRLKLNNAGYSVTKNKEVADKIVVQYPTRNNEISIVDLYHETCKTECTLELVDKIVSLAKVSPKMAISIIYDVNFKGNESLLNYLMCKLYSRCIIGNSSIKNVYFQSLIKILKPVTKLRYSESFLICCRTETITEEVVQYLIKKDNQLITRLIDDFSYRTGLLITEFNSEYRVSSPQEPHKNPFTSFNVIFKP